ncbi:MAG TPA: hypothetical protein VG963_19855, partial [Polyangiaceae bacterium]|nr:hypothetical protein [Polyangiaceae bacterium]
MPKSDSPASEGAARRAATWPWLMVWLAFSLTVLALAVRHVSPEHFALFWDDALFFKRVSYNILHHGFAGWNQADGPVFVNTSQLFQLVATVLLGLFPGSYNAAVTFWGAIALSASFPLLMAAARASLPGALLLFCLLQAPPIALSLTTGMETPTVTLILAAFLYVALCAQAPETIVRRLAALQVLVYAVRPDALLLSFTLVAGMLASRTAWRQLLSFMAWTALGLLLLSAAFHAYYGTFLPLSFFLKFSPLSIYDSDYTGMGLTSKLQNLAQTVLMILPLAPVILLRRDRVNLALCAAGVVFIAFHGLTTFEIAAYHARFYEPALPFFFAAALRGVPELSTRTRQAGVFAFGVFAASLLWVAYQRGWIENAGGYGPDIVTPLEYARYLVGVPALALALAVQNAGERLRRALPVALAAGMAAFATVSSLPSSWGIVSDEVSDTNTIGSHTADVGIDVIRRCFQQPFQMTHSEIGLPGVLFLESRIIDFTGLANPKVTDGSFDFEAMCTDERPEFIYRPHWTH